MSGAEEVAMPERQGVLTIHFVRHGETLATAEGRFCGQRDCALSDRGRRQEEAIVERCAAGGEWRAVYTSPLTRCRAMAEAFAARLGIPLAVEDCLQEIDHGTWDGRLEEEVENTEPDAYRAYVRHPGIFGAPQGENGFQVAARALPVVERIRAAHRDGDVLVVSHKATIRIIACALLGIDVDLYRARLSQPVASVTSFDFPSSGPRLLRLGFGASGSEELGPREPHTA
jgi:broad specificity phosphatase PhoE